METFTREEMMKMAADTRKNVTSSEVSDAELMQYPVHMEEITVPVRGGETKVYYSYLEKGEHLGALIVNFHGGGFIKARTRSDELFCRELNHLIGCKVMDVDYHIAPEYPYPFAVEECLDTVNWIFDHSGDYQVDPGKIMLLGHSAGGNLAIVTQMQLLAGGLGRQPLCLAVEYPPLDLYTDPEEKTARGQGIPPERARLYNLYYCERESQKEPYVSPVYAEEEKLRGFPPTLILTAGKDDLYTEAEEFALKLARCGNEVTLKRVEGAGHAFTVYRKEKHREGMETIVGYLKKFL